MTSHGSEINWEAALGDVKDLVCRHLSQEDLCTLTKVNLSWREAAMREISKRYYPEVAITLVRKPSTSVDKQIKNTTGVHNSGPQLSFEQPINDLEKRMRTI